MASINDVNAKEIDGNLYVPVVVKNDPNADIVVVSRTWHPPFLQKGVTIRFMIDANIIDVLILDIYGDWIKVQAAPGLPNDSMWPGEKWLNVRHFKICAPL